MLHKIILVLLALACVRLAMIYLSVRHAKHTYKTVKRLIAEFEHKELSTFTAKEILEDLKMARSRLETEIFIVTHTAKGVGAAFFDLRKQESHHFIPSLSEVKNLFEEFEYLSHL